MASQECAPVCRTKKADPQMKAGFRKTDKKISIVAWVLWSQARTVCHFLSTKREQQVFRL